MNDAIERAVFEAVADLAEREAQRVREEILVMVDEVSTGDDNFDTAFFDDLLTYFQEVFDESL